MTNFDMISMTTLFANNAISGTVININSIQEADTRAIVMDRALRAVYSILPEKDVKTDVEGQGTISVVRGSYMFQVVETWQVGMAKDEQGHNVVCVKSDKGGDWMGIDWETEVMAEARHYKKAEKLANQSEQQDFHGFEVGGFVWATNEGSKENTVLDYLRWFQNDLDEGHFNVPCLCRIDRIEELTEDELDGYQFMDEKPEGFEGGCYSDDVPEDFDGINYSGLTYSQKHSFIHSVCILRTPTRWVAVDPQGYGYCRYVYFPLKWRKMFAADIEKAAEKERQYQAYLQAQQDERDKAQQARYDERTERILRATNGLKGYKPIDWDKKGAQTRCNNVVKRILAAVFPGTIFTASKSWDWHSVEVEWTGGPSNDEVRDIMEALQGDKWNTGETDYSGYGGYIMEYRHNQVTKVIGKISNYRAYQRTA